MMRIEEIQDYIRSLNIPNLYEGKSELEIQTYCPLKNLKNSAITWVRNIDDIDGVAFDDYTDILLVADKESKRAINGVNVLWVDNPQRTFFKILERFFSDVDPQNVGSGIASSAVVETSDIGINVFVGHHCYIGKDVKVEDDVKIYHNVTLEGHVTVGRGSVIASGAKIGICGFGHYQDFDGTEKCVPHLGGVQIGQDVRIGANTVICRGCLDDTVIEDHVRISSLCNIAHNNHIKKGAIITAGVITAGSSTIGEDTWIAPGAVLNNGIVVEDQCFVGLGSVATKSLEKNGVYVGAPAKRLRDR